MLRVGLTGGIACGKTYVRRRMQDAGLQTLDLDLVAHEVMAPGGAASFFYKGTNGRWRDTLTDDDLALAELAAFTLDPNLRSWLEDGRHAAGI